MSAELLAPMADGSVLYRDTRGQLWIGWVKRQKPNNQDKLMFNWRKMNLPGEPLPYSEKEPTS